MLPFTRALLYVAALVSAGAAPQAPSGGPATVTYRRLVDDYRHQNAASAQRVGLLPETEIRRLVDEALSAPGESSWKWDALLAAAMVHTDASLALLGSGRTDAAFAHLNAAIRLLEAATSRERASQPLATLWYQNLSAILINIDARRWADHLSARLQPVLEPAAGEAAFVRGLNMEIVACDVDPGIPADGFGMQLSTPLKAAATHFEEALRRDPSLHKAALHLGRSRLLLGALADARRWLEVATQSPQPSERYLAFLYLGAMEERDGRVDQAEARYRAALSAFPWGQSGPLALARVLSRTNRETESRDVVARMLERRRRVEPLWMYLVKPGSEPGAALELIRAEIWQ